jgi:hypothetical protein
MFSLFRKTLALDIFEALAMLIFASFAHYCRYYDTVQQIIFKKHLSTLSSVFDYDGVFIGGT